MSSSKFAVLCIIILFLIQSKKMGKKAELNALLSERRVQSDILEDDTKSEYDFMNTQAAIPAKLDLARSYIAMSDHDQARAVLNTVLEKGDEEQRIVAEALLNKIQKLQNE